MGRARKRSRVVVTEETYHPATAAAAAAAALDPGDVPGAAAAGTGRAAALAGWLGSMGCAYVGALEIVPEHGARASHHASLPIC